MYIQSSFVEAIQLNAKDYRYLSTDSFIARMRKKNWHSILADANQWIERNQPDFAQKTTDGSDNRYWTLPNMGEGFQMGLFRQLLTMLKREWLSILFVASMETGE